MFYIGRRYSAANTVSRRVDVSCEKCGCAYRYKLVRRGTGWAVAPYMIGAWNGAERARNHAVRVANRRLARGVEPVPCPDCGWLQADMVREVRRRRFRALDGAAVTLSALMIVILGLVILLGTDGFQRTFSHLMYNDGPAIWTLAGLAVVLPAILLSIRWLAQRAINPNRRHPEPPTPFLDAPAAIRTRDLSATAAPVPLLDDEEPTADANGSGGPRLTHARRDPDVLPGGWVTVQLLHAFWPARCATCGEPTTHTRERHPRGQTLVKVNVPLCPACRRHEKRRSWLLGGATAALCFLVLIPPIAHDPRPGALAITVLGMLTMAGLVGLFAVIFDDRLRSPVRFRNYAADRNTVQVRFRNPAYAERFQAANRRSSPTLAPANGRASRARQPTNLSPPPMPATRPRPGRP